MSDKRGFIVIISCVLLAILSIVVLSPHFSSTRTWRDQIEQLDDYADTARRLSLASTGLSIAITVSPDDIGTPVAESVQTISFIMLLITGMIYFEKFMLTTFGFFSCSIVLPISLVTLACSYGFKDELREKMLRLAFRTFVSALCLLLIIPVSINVCDLVEKTHSEEIELVLQKAEQTTKELEAANDDNTSAAETEDLNIFQKAGKLVSDTAESIGNAISDGVENVVGAVSGAVDKAKNVLSDLVDAFSVMLVVVCVMPIMTWIAFVTILKLLWKIDLPGPKTIIDNFRGFRFNKSRSHLR